MNLFFLFIITAVTIAACTTDFETPRSPGSLVVYSGRSESLVGSIIDQFSETTGIDVKVNYGSTSALAATLMEEGANSPADVFFAQESGSLGAVSGMFALLAEDLKKKVPMWARSPEGKWVGVSGRARVVVYNRERLSEHDLPASLMGFIDSKWKGKIGWAPTNASFQAMVAAMHDLWGEEQTRYWLKSIKDNDPKMYPKNTPIVAGVASGDVDVGFVNHYYLYRFIQEDGEDFPARNYHLGSGGPGNLIMVAGIGILETAPNSKNAEKFLRFMLSEMTQQYFTDQTYEYPLVDGVKTNRLLIPMVEINNPEIDIVSVHDLRGTQRMLRDLGILP